MKQITAKHFTKVEGFSTGQALVAFGTVIGFDGSECGFFAPSLPELRDAWGQVVGGELDDSKVRRVLIFAHDERPKGAKPV